MTDKNSDSKNKTSDTVPAPEVLKPQDDNASTAASDRTREAMAKKASLNLKLRHSTYRPSHKATFIGLAVVIVVLAINAAIIAFMINSTQGGDNADANKSEVTINTDVLDKLGVSRDAGNLGTELIVGPDSRFNGTLTVGGDTSIAGELKLNGKLSANDVSLASLSAGDTTVDKININGDGTVSNLIVRDNLTVDGQTTLQGAVTIGQLLTVTNNLNITGNLAVGGTLSIGAFQTNTLTVGGHLITRGSAPSVSPGSSLGSNGTVSISGNDVSGTVAVNIGTGGGSGILASVYFVNQYTSTPHVVVSTIGSGAGSLYISRSSSGFSIGVNGSLAPGGYAFDYIVMQ